MTNFDYTGVYLSRGIWELWHNKTWDDYIHKFYKDTVQKFVADEETKNILLYGDNGMGKSMLMNLAMKDLLHKGKLNLISLLKLSIKRFVYLKFIVAVASKVSIAVKF